MYKMLVIEDEEAIQTLIRDIFACDAYSIDTCFNGYEGMKAFESGAYDIVITDIVMPHIDGLTFMQALRSMETHGPKTPIIAISGGARSIGSKTALSAAAIYANDVLQKPFDPLALKKMVLTLLDNKSALIPHALKSANINADTPSPQKKPRL